MIVNRYKDKIVKLGLVRQTKDKVKYYNTKKRRDKEIAVPWLFTLGKFWGWNFYLDGKNCNALTVGSLYVLLFQWLMSVWIARMSGTILKLGWGDINWWNKDQEKLRKNKRDEM